jgi:hypothetical protein
MHFCGQMRRTSYSGFNKNIFTNFRNRPIGTPARIWTLMAPLVAAYLFGRSIKLCATPSMLQELEHVEVVDMKVVPTTWVGDVRDKDQGEGT